MKYCGKCGRQLEDRAKFCPGCGTPIDPVPQAAAPQAPDYSAPPVYDPQSALDYQPEADYPETEMPVQEAPSKPKKKIATGKVILFAVISVLLIAVIVCGALVVRWYNSNEQRALRALDAGDYDTVQELMDRDMSVFDSQAVNERLQARIDSIQAGFLDGSIEYASAKMELASISGLEVEDLQNPLSSAAEVIDRVNQSRADYSTAESFYASGDYDEAIAYYKLVIEDDPNYEAAVAKLAEAVNAYRAQVLEDAAQAVEAGSYSSAITKLNAALLVIPDDADITEQIRLYEKQYAQQQKEDALATASAYATSGKYYEAYKSLESILQLQPTDSDLLLAYNTYYDFYIGQVKSEAIAAADAQVASGEYIAAIATIETAIDKIGEDSELLQAYDTYCGRYVSAVISEVDEQMEQKDFTGAISTLNAAIETLPGQDELTQKLEEVKAKRPISITTLLAVNSDWVTWNSGSPTDPFGNDYSTACNYAILGYHYGREYYQEYRLYGEYSSLTGTIATHISSAEGETSRLQVYVDDVLTYTSPDLGRKTDAIGFSVNVSGAEYVKIVVYTNNYNAKAILSDVQLWP